MSYLSMPICYFPSRVMLFCQTEDLEFKQLAQSDLSGVYALTHSVEAALQLLTEAQSDPELLTLQCTTHAQHAKVLANLLAEEDLASIHAEVYNPCRFFELSVAVIDLTCSALHGQDFCQQGSAGHIKKIALIHADDEPWAQQGLTEHLFQAYLIKDGDWLNQIKPLIEQLKRVYFLEMSAMIARLLPRKLPASVYDPVVGAFVAQLMAEQRCVEYYLIASKGIFLLLDEQAQVSFLMIEPMSTRTELSWNNQVLSAQPIIDSGYVYAHWVLPQPSLMGIVQEQIVSYMQFIQEWVAGEPTCA